MGNWIGDESDPWNQVDDTLGVEQDGDGGGYWVGDESDPWNPDHDSGNQRDNAALELGTRLADIPADFGNTLTGTGENVGWMGVVDRQLDPRSWGSSEPDWADPSEETTGISGFWRGATGAAGGAVDETTSGISAGLLNSPKLLILLAVAALAMLAPYVPMLATVMDP